MSGEKAKNELHEELIIIILAIFLHYAIEYGSSLGDYSCPSYCEVKHEHIIKKGEVK